ncbi:MAG: AI-2E family transporter [Pseudomonadales bacterium]|nr:AI-2E family transporter [Pseudomonadales bacterium]
MKRIFSKWIERYFSNEEALFLFILLAASLVIILTLGGPLAPVIAGLILAFLMQGAVGWLENKNISHMISVNLVFAVFFSALLAFVIIVIPLAWQQLAKLFNDIPHILQQIQAGLLVLPENYPGIVTEQQISQVVAMATQELSSVGQWMLAYSFNSLGTIVALLIYFVLVPILVFFFLKDGKSLVQSWTAVLPHKREMMTKVWHEMDVQIANYIRGKTLEIFIVGFVTYLGFIFFDLDYAALLAIMVGLSVLVPYIGAALVTLPVAVIGFFQFGWGNEFFYLMLVYGVIQALDGNVLVPLLFSEAVNLHPIAIIIAGLVFGTIWGFWGVFFAIPLATLIKAIFSAWPKPVEELES